MHSVPSCASPARSRCALSAPPGSSSQGGAVLRADQSEGTGLSRVGLEDLTPRGRLRGRWQGIGLSGEVEQIPVTLLDPDTLQPHAKGKALRASIALDLAWDYASVGSGVHLGLDKGGIDGFSLAARFSSARLGRLYPGRPVQTERIALSEINGERALIQNPASPEASPRGGSALRDLAGSRRFFHGLRRRSGASHFASCPSGRRRTPLCLHRRQLAQGLLHRQRSRADLRTPRGAGRAEHPSQHLPLLPRRAWPSWAYTSRPYTSTSTRVPTSPIPAPIAPTPIDVSGRRCSKMSTIRSYETSPRRARSTSPPCALA